MSTLIANYQDDRPECLRCCVATALEIHEDAIPRVRHGDEDWFWKFFDDLERALGVQLEPVASHQLPSNTGELYLAVLSTANLDANHVVVCRYGHIVFDPADHWSGVVGPTTSNLQYGFRLRKVG